jgi:hypothetical protein
VSLTHKVKIDMPCSICCHAYDLDRHVPLGLLCGHTFCKSCLLQSVELPAAIRCFNCRAREIRCISDIPKNLELIETLKLEAAARFEGLRLESSSSIANRSSPVLSRMWLEEDELQLSATVLGAGAMGQVVAGTYEGREVSIYCSGCCSCTVK